VGKTLQIKPFPVMAATQGVSQAMHSTLLPQQQLHGFSCMIKIEN
jgi:hypothetical protein